MNSLWDIRIFLGLVPKESPCTKISFRYVQCGRCGLHSKGLRLLTNLYQKEPPNYITIGWREGNSSLDKRLEACQTCSTSHVICRALATRSTKKMRLLDSPFLPVLTRSTCNYCALPSGILRGRCGGDLLNRTHTIAFYLKSDENTAQFIQRPLLRSCVHS